MAFCSLPLMLHVFIDQLVDNRDGNALLVQSRYCKTDKQQLFKDINGAYDNVHNFGHDRNAEAAVENSKNMIDEADHIRYQIDRRGEK